MSENVVITGAPKVADPNDPGAGPVPQPRLDIRDFVKNEKYLSLYVQALAQFSAVSQDEDVSHFGVGGIHGLPYRPWSNSGPQPDPDTQWGGYCTHGTVLFPTWHRPYVGAYEQFIQQAAVEIAGGYNDPEWQQAAQTLRLPFWDWASSAVPPDEIISQAQITIATPGGSQTVTNPFWGYVFHPIDSSFRRPYNAWRKTLRRPTSTASNAQDNVSALKRVLAGNAANITKDTYKLFSITDWDQFSNHSATQDSNTSSLETIHDGIHGLVGGSGHMGNPAYAGHDPIFFLHHCNVDRLLALWQAVHYDVPITSGDSNGGTWTIGADETIGENTPLTPFYNTQDSYWISTATAPDFTVLGYTYPEFEGLDLNDKQAVRIAISQRIEELYGPAVRAPRLGSAVSGGQVPVSSAIDTQSVNYDQEWSAHISCNQFELGSSFYVFIFLGDAPEDSEKWFEAENLLGVQGFFVNSESQKCGNCQTQADKGAVVEGFVHMSDTLLSRGVGENGSLSPEKILPYLKKEGVNVRVMKNDGEIIDPEKFKSLAVEVVATPVKQVKHSPLPHLGQVHKHYTIYEAEDAAA